VAPDIRPQRTGKLASKGNVARTAALPFAGLGLQLNPI